MALCVYGDAGWGRLVQRGKYVDGDFADELVDASAKAIREHWRWDPAPTWVTALPSTARAGIVDRFARRLAARLGLPYVEALSVGIGGSPQKDMQNSAMQCANARRRLGVDAASVRAGPVLLVDDLVDSGWTLTVAGWLLRSRGSGTVHPFALAQSSSRDD
jgi:ATP-dependent DNA helicase RecQ